ncbi:hypothetical protein Q3G72_012263 [Acer saccharum]|nr:hypothetical protein Q3G72_012263 [Acer saccharum]
MKNPNFQPPPLQHHQYQTQILRLLRSLRFGLVVNVEHHIQGPPRREVTSPSSLPPIWPQPLPPPSSTQSDPIVDEKIQEIVEVCLVGEKIQRESGWCVLVGVLGVLEN